MPALRLPPSRPVGPEDIRDLQGWAPHERGLRGAQVLQKTDHFAQDVGGYLRIQRGGFQFLVPEQDLDHADIDFLFQQMGGETVATMGSFP